MDSGDQSCKVSTVPTELSPQSPKPEILSVFLLTYIIQVTSQMFHQGLGCSSVLKHLPRMQEAMGSVSSTAKIITRCVYSTPVPHRDISGIT